MHVPHIFWSISSLGSRLIGGFSLDGDDSAADQGLVSTLPIWTLKALERTRETANYFRPLAL